MYIVSGSPILTENTIHNGLYAPGVSTFTALTANTFVQDDTHSLYLHPDVVGIFSANSEVKGWGTQSFIQIAGGTLSKDASWKHIIPYHLMGSITIMGEDGEDGHTTLTLQPEVELKFAKNSQLTVGSTNIPGAIIADGTEQHQIRLTSAMDEPAPGDWAGIYFYSGAADFSSLKWTTIENGGYSSQGSVYVLNASPAFDNIRVRDSKYAAVYINGGTPIFTNTSLASTTAYGMYIQSGTPSLHGNTIHNGLYAPSTIFTGFESNSFTQDNAHPIYIHPESVGIVSNNSVITNLDDASNIQIAGGTISKDASWAPIATYYIRGTLYIRGTDGDDGVTTLSIDPAVELQFATNTTMYVGYSTTPGALIAVGTEMQPILFTSAKAEPAAGDWGGLYFYPGAADFSSIKWATIEYAGNSNAGSIYIQNASPAFDHITVTDSKYSAINANGGAPSITNSSFSSTIGYGLYISAGTPTLSGNTIYNGIYSPTINFAGYTGNTIVQDDAHPIYLNAETVGEFSANSSITGLTSTSVIQVSGGTISKDTTWRPVAPYQILGTVTVQGNDGDDAVTTLTLQPDTELRFAKNTAMYIGYSTTPGALKAEGTENKRIRFTSAQDTPTSGDWTGLSFYPSAADFSTIQWATISYAGMSPSYGSVYIQGASPAFNHVTITDSKYAATYIHSGLPVFSNCDFESSLGYGVNITGGSPTLISNTINNGLYAPAINFTALSSNSFVQDDAHPIYLHPNAVGMFCDSNTLTGLTDTSIIQVAGGSISQDASWKAITPYHMLGSITIQGTDGEDGVTSLTIDPAAELQFARNTQMIIGYSTTPGAVIINGTEEEKVVFTSDQAEPSPGDWLGLYFYPGAGDYSSLRWTDIQYAGTSPSYGAAYINGASPSFNHVTIANSKYAAVSIISGLPVLRKSYFESSLGYGVNLTGGTPTLIENTINNGLYAPATTFVALNSNTFVQDDAHPIYLHPNAVGMFCDSSTITGLTDTSVIQVAGGIISQDATWKAVAPYHMLASIAIRGTDGEDGVTSLTIDSGAELRFARNTQIAIGYSSTPGALIANGTEQSQILFTSAQATPSSGDWSGLYFYSGAADFSTLAWTNIQYAGYSSYGSLYIQGASPTLDHVTVLDSKYAAVNISGGTPVITDGAFASANGYGIYISSGNPSLTGNTIYNGIYSASVSFSNYSGNTLIQDDNHPVYLSANAVGPFSTGSTITGLTENSEIFINGGTLSQDATWKPVAPYRVRGSLTVQGTDGDDQVTTLRIEPGVTVRFNQNTQISVAYSAPGAVIAEGTEEKPILFTSGQAEPAPGDWYGLNVNSRSSDLSAFKWTTVEYAGGSGNGTFYSNQASPLLDHVTLQYSKNYALRVNGGAPSVTNSTITNGIYMSSGTFTQFVANTLVQDDAHPFYIATDAVGLFSESSTITDTNENTVVQIPGGILIKDATWNPIAPFQMMGSMTIRGTDGDDGVTTLTINPDVEVRFARNTQIAMGYSTIPGALITQGTEEHQVLFTSAQAEKAAGDWYGLYFYPVSSDMSSIAWTTIQYAGGSGSGTVYVNNASPTLDHVTLQNSKYYGINISNGSPTITNSTIQNGLYISSGNFAEFTANTMIQDDAHPIYLIPDVVGTFSATSSVTGLNDTSAVQIAGGILSKDTTWKPVAPYQMMGSMTIRGTDGDDGVTTLTIDPDVEVRFARNTQIAVGYSTTPGALITQGTEESQVLFTSAQAEKAAGDWYGVTFNPVSSDMSSLNWTTIRYAGGSGSGAVYAYNASPIIDHLTIAHTKYTGIRVQGGEPTITASNFVNLGGCAITNSSSTMIQAENNWFGDASGPLDNSDDTANGGLYNPDGSGACVSDHVDYEPWLTISQVDTDLDGLTDYDEVNIYGTDPNLVDTDNDGIPDNQEEAVLALKMAMSSKGTATKNVTATASTSSSLPPVMLYENAEDGLLEGWDIFDNDPVGASIDNFYDAEKKSQIIKLFGAETANGYRFRNADGTWWENNDHSILQWSINAADTFIVTAVVQTSSGIRYLQYQPVDEDSLGSGEVIDHGLGIDAKGGQWRSFTRDLAFDLKEAQPGNELEAVLGFLVRGNCSVDDIQTMSVLPGDLDSDNDGISDVTEIEQLHTHPYFADSDGDGIGDGDELEYWQEQWNSDADNDSLINILDPDSDSDGVLDGVEIQSGTNPASAASHP
ncbi:thrombospondin type 3 repeat-containing protein [Desulfogranum japonicum]|uniref:thrombospondin type 3 repeat-containing protein n=1 Tax=Desulfogranum japonicum TaxID=231447 RepID=UPI0003FBBD2A|nr:thrombospondin type 3 repeat-containing protein [Desulfogranum japonicum]